MVSGWINSGSRCYGVEKSVFRSFSGSAHAMARKIVSYSGSKVVEVHKNCCA